MTTSDELASTPRATGESPVWEPPAPEAGQAGEATSGEVANGEFANGGEVVGGGEASGGGEATGGGGVRPPEARLRPPVRTSGRSRAASSTSILLVVSALIALAGIGFAVGRATGGGSGTTGDNPAGLTGGFPESGAGASGRPDLAGANPGGLGGATTVSGTVVATTADSITIQLAGGEQVTLSTGASTTYHSQTSASVSDVAVGASVIVQTSGDDSAPGVAAGASPGTGTGSSGTPTATDVTITGN